MIGHRNATGVGSGIGVDVGGTFTGVVAQKDAGGIAAPRRARP